MHIVTHTAKFGLRDAIVAVLWNITNSSDSQSVLMLLERRNKPQFNVVISLTTWIRILLGPQIIHRSCLDHNFVCCETKSSSRPRRTS